MQIEDQIEMLKKISYKEIIFHLAEKGSIEDLKSIVDKIGYDNLGEALCEVMDTSFYRTRYKQATNEKNHNILEVLLYNKRPLEFLQYFVEKIKEKRPYSENRGLIKDYYRDWHMTPNGFLLDLVIKENNIDYYDFMKNEGFITRNDAFLSSLTSERKMFKHVCKDYNFDKVFSGHFTHKEELKEKNNFLDFLTTNKDNKNLISNFKLLENREWFIAEIMFTAIQEEKKEIYFLFENQSIFSIVNQKGDNIFKVLKNQDEKIASFIKLSKIDLLYKNKDGKNILDLINLSDFKKESFPLTLMLIEKAIINEKVLNSKNTVDVKRINKRL